MVLQLGRNLGYEVNGVFAVKSAGGDFAAEQKRAWQFATSAIDQGIPCFAWELDIPEYYVVHGYDDTGYLFSGPGSDGGDRHTPWQKLGDTPIRVLEMFSVRPGQPTGDAQIVKEALLFALEHSTSPEKWVFPKYKAGLDGYDSWIRSLEAGTPDSDGTAYNAAVWTECRGFAVRFLQEARQRLAGRADAQFDEAIRRYQAVFESLQIVADRFPFHGREPGHVRDTARVGASLGALARARDAEAEGLRALRDLVQAL
jgi:hypothetical protein